MTLFLATYLVLYLHRNREKPSLKDVIFSRGTMESR